MYGTLSYREYVKLRDLPSQPFTVIMTASTSAESTSEATATQAETDNNNAATVNNEQKQE